MTAYGFSTNQVNVRCTHTEWPRNSDVLLSRNIPTLLLFVHPQCPCTRASIGELEKILSGPALAPGQQPRVVVVATLPGNASQQWRETDTVESAQHLPNVTMFWDIDGIEASRFGALVSGTVMLYSPAGTRLFTGGVTMSRGHEGGNIGSDRLWTVLTCNEPVPQLSTPVFGCPLCIANTAVETEEASYHGVAK